MGQLTSVKRVFIVERYYSNKTPTKVKRVSTNEFNMNICIKTVSKVVSKWRPNGTIHSLNKGHSGRSKYVRSDANMVHFNERINEDPSLSVKKLAAEV